jgi:drug/metabolite transporter (DMT)-like permease
MNLPPGAGTGRASQAGLLFIMGSVLLWGAMPFLIEFIVISIPPVELTTLRMVAAGLLLVVPIGFRAFGRSLRQHLRLFLLLGFLGSAVPQVLYAYALQWVPIPTLTFITNSYPAFSILLAILILGERPQARHIIGMISALVGLYLLTGPTITTGGRVTLGMAMAFVIALAWGSSSIVSKKLITDLPSNHVAAGRQLLAGVLAAPLMLAGGVQLTGVPAVAWVALGLLVIMTVFSFLFYYRGLARTTVTNASLVEAFTPVVTLILSALFFGESLAPVQLLGAGLILVGTILVTVEGLRGRALGTPAESQEVG